MIDPRQLPSLLQGYSDKMLFMCAASWSKWQTDWKPVMRTCSDCSQVSSSSASPSSVWEDSSLVLCFPTGVFIIVSYRIGHIFLSPDKVAKFWGCVECSSKLAYYGTIFRWLINWLVYRLIFFHYFRCNKDVSTWDLVYPKVAILEHTIWALPQWNRYFSGTLFLDTYSLVNPSFPTAN